jgi:hypothetical protein
VNLLKAPRVILALNRKVADTLGTATAIHDGLASNANVFPAPTPPVTTLASLIQVANGAAQAVTSKTGSVATRTRCMQELVSALRMACAYVQTVADASPDEAAHVAGIAGMRIASNKPAQKPLLALQLGIQPGSIVAKANATLLREGPRKAAATFYEWRCTGDGGKTYVTSTTPVATATFTGLTALTTYAVQVATTTRAGTSAWSQAVTLLMH